MAFFGVFVFSFGDILPLPYMLSRFQRRRLVLLAHKPIRAAVSFQKVAAALDT